MNSKQKADLVAWAHLILILYGIISLPLLFLISWWYKFVFILAGFTIISWIAFHRECWITKLENKFRKQHHIDESYEGSFIKYYLKKIFNINCSLRTINIILYSYLFLLSFVALKQAL